MPSILNPSGVNQESFDAFLAGRDEPEWLIAGRRAAWQAFQDLPLPSRADEEWMRTDIRLFRLDKFHLPRAIGAASGFAITSAGPARSRRRTRRPNRGGR